jgi:uncharacterized secreted protein with C-terminal beta-propeller domain
MILSALKIPGFSTYMHPWSSQLLLGIGYNANEQGRTDSVKLSMFNITNPSFVTEQDKYNLDIYYTPALYDHKAIMVEPARNLIGFASDDGYYLVFAYRQSGFYQLAKLPIGETRFSGHTDNYFNNTRGLYVGDSLYIFSDTYLDVYDLNTFEYQGSINIIDGNPAQYFHGGLMPM